MISERYKCIGEYNTIMNRRTFTKLVGVGAVGSVAGCLSNVDTVDELPRPVLGYEESDITVRVFEDLGCPACARYEARVFPDVESQYIETDIIRYEFYDYVLPASPISGFLNNAARGVQDRVGNDAFWEFVSLVFDNQSQMDTDLTQELAGQVGVDEPEVLTNDAEGGVYDPVLESDKSFGQDNYGNLGTPTVVINDTVVDSADFNTISSAIDQISNR